ncbi:MAG: lysylphosphatidylglycerol synthase transmembrane domain-containing protein [Myxococcota bacterium]
MAGKSAAGTPGPIDPLRAEAQAAADTPARWRDRAKKILPWFVAVGMILYVFSRVPLAQAWSAVRSADLGLFVAVMVAGILAWFAIESTLYAWLFTRFNAPVDRVEARALRGMSYLLTPINWNVGKALVILRLKQTKGVPILESTSTVMFYQSVDGIILAGFAAAGMTALPALVAGADDLSEARGWALGVIALTIANLAILRATRPSFRALTWWRELRIHQAHRRFAPRDLAILISGKAAYHFLYVLVFYFGTKAFGIDLPFPLALAATPIIQVIGGLPISPAGLGTQQAAMLYFFGSRFGGTDSEAAIVAFGFSFPVALALGRCALGLFYVKEFSAARATTSPA